MDSPTAKVKSKVDADIDNGKLSADLNASLSAGALKYLMEFVWSNAWPCLAKSSIQGGF